MISIWLSLVERSDPDLVLVEVRLDEQRRSEPGGDRKLGAAPARHGGERLA
jgi:hypothetical protein